jgi:hypothetical protein
VDALTLFDARSKCWHCLRALGQVTWLVKVSTTTVVVCPECAHNYPRKRQLPPR